jgi:hypothetical protein
MSEENPRRNLETVADNRDAALELARSARRSLVIFSHDLEPALLDQPGFVEEVRRLALSGRYARVNILLKDSTRAIRDGHRLLGLVRRLTSYMEIRKPHPDYMDINESFIVADEHGVMYRTLADRWEGIFDLDDPLRAREKLRLFREIWERSQPEPEARRLGI